MAARAAVNRAKSCMESGSVSVATARRTVPFCSMTRDDPQFGQIASGPTRTDGSLVTLHTLHVIIAYSESESYAALALTIRRRMRLAAMHHAASCPTAKQDTTHSADTWAQPASVRDHPWT